MGRNEAIQYFIEARKLGGREFKKSVSKGHSGYLPFLDGVIKNVEIVGEADLGVVEIPLDKVVGTYTQSRSKAFASNFMPIMDEQTEFYNKWTKLCEIHLTEGIRDPIKVYEFLNWFYVVEGNKRVSVLKFFEAYSIPGKVTRLIPKMDSNDPDIKIYYEFMNFYKQTGINNIWFSRENGFNTLLQLLGDYDVPGLEGREKYKYFSHSVYLTFRKVYHETGGDNLPITTGDALLEYVKLYGIPVMIEEDDLKHRLSEFMDELESIAKQDSIHIRTELIDIGAKNLFTTLTTFVKPPKTLKVAFAYPKSAQKSNWTFAHEIGRMHVEKVMQGQVETIYINHVPESMEAYEYLKTLAMQGNDVIFATSPFFIKATLKAALEHTDVRFLNCSETHSFRHVSTYFGRLYEPRFLLGMIAGAMTLTNVLGYIGTIPVPGVICGINAFALGARMVNPKVKVIVAWTRLRNGGNAIEDAGMQLAQAGVDYISHQNALANRTFTREFGLYSVMNNGERKRCIPHQYIAAPVWNWGIFYERIIKSILNESKFIGSNPQLINYWWGMDTGVADIFYSNKYVPRETQKLIELIRSMIAGNSFHPFKGPVYDQSGNVRIPRDEIAGHEQILNMDWFVDAVESELPGLEEFSETELLADMV